MKDYKKISVRLLKKYFLTKKQKESEYYKKMFINNPNWNKPKPNSEEILRWGIIETFMQYILDGFNFEKKQKILDLGCGRGWLTNLLSQYSDNIVGVEPVKPVVSYAKKMFPKIHFICGTLEDLVRKNKNEKFDLIVSSEVIEHIPNNEKENFINNISKLLKNNGFLILTTPRKESLQEWNNYIKENQPIEDWLTENELEKLVLKKTLSN